MAKQPSLVSQVRTALSHHADSVGMKKDGTITVRRGYFYRNGMDSTRFATQTAQRLAAAGITLFMKEHGDHWSAFRGGSTIANSSHFWVEFTAV
jgi:hypothetical protein